MGNYNVYLKEGVSIIFSCSFYSYDINLRPG